MINKKIIFFGTPDFAVPALTALHQEGYNLSLVITQADQPVGRKQALTPPPVKLAAQKLGLPICQKLSGVKNFKADLGGVVAYGKIIPQNFGYIFLRSFKYSSFFVAQISRTVADSGGHFKR